MRIQADRVFIEALQKHGFDGDYKKFIEIYRESRNNPIVQRRRRENEAINAAMIAKFGKPE